MSATEASLFSRHEDFDATKDRKELIALYCTPVICFAIGWMAGRL